jgi:molecular chaperone DnaK
MPVIIGIDLGTTNSCVAHLSAAEPRVIPNLEGAPTTPSMVAYSVSGEILVGPSARRQAVMNSRRTLYAVKRLIGRKFASADVRAAARRLPFALAPAANGDILVEVGGRKLSPQEISSHLLAYLKKCAESHLGEPVREAVITVPAHFGDHQRQATKDAAQIAGLEVARMINEPTAASLAFGLHKKKNGKVAVIDLGGGTFDVTILEIAGGIFQVLATNGDTDLGGEDFDARVMDWLIGTLPAEVQAMVGENPSARLRIKEAAERAKCELSFTTETDIQIPFLEAGGEAQHVKTALTRAALEGLTGDLIEKMVPVIDRTLTECRLSPDKIDHILLVGGQTRMPLLRRRMTQLFNRKSEDSIDPDQCVAVGAAVQTGILQGEMSDIVLLLDVTSMSLGIEIEGDAYEKLIEKNTTIPTKKTKPFTTVENNQRQVRVHVLQGDEPRASMNTSLAMFDLVGIPPAPAGIPQIDVTFEIDADGIVRVRAKDFKSGLEQAIEIEPSSGLTKQEVLDLIQRGKDEDRRKGR